MYLSEIVLRAVSAATATQTIAQINGLHFLSLKNGSNVTGVKGLVTAKGPSGFWMRSTTPDNDNRTSESIYVYGSSGLNKTAVGNIITLNARVSEYRSSAAYLYLTELEDATSISNVSTGNPVTPVVLGRNGLNPPTEEYTSLDKGGPFGLPGNQSQISVKNPYLQPSKYGLDFWESLTGELVTVKSPRALDRPDTYGDTWVVGDWYTSGNNSRGGLTLTAKDANPEAIVIGEPLDGTKNPKTTKLGDSLSDITGIVTYAYGFYTILPLTKITITASQQPAVTPPTSLTSTGDCTGITIAQYNIENFSPKSKTAGAIASQIVNALKIPDIIFLQEIQDDDGSDNDGVVDANKTLAYLTHAINNVSSTTNYSYVDINPVNDENGGEPGGNIRVAYLYNPKVVHLYKPNPGNSTQATQVLPGPVFSYNPGRIDPKNEAFYDSRRPLAAEWELADGKSRFFTINVQFTAKLGSSSLYGDYRPPINGGVDQRNMQANVTGTFISQILAQDSQASVIFAGDCNEFAFVEPLQTLVKVSGLKDMDTVVGTPSDEIYTYLYQQNAQELDHMFVSSKIAKKSAAYEHVHVNTWVDAADEISDHDPSVAKLNVCT